MRILDIDTTTIGQNVRALRDQAGLTQAQLAEDIDKSPIHISHIENGLTSISLECLLSLCVALETTPNIILKGTYPVASSDSSDLLMESPSDSSIPATDTRNLAIEIADIIMERLER